jgi:hypothetical protein
MITEDYVSFETAKLLKEKGFDTSEIDAYFPFVYYANGKMDFYDDDNPLFVCEAVTLQMAMKWLRVNYHLNPVPYALSLGWAFDIFDLTGRDITGCRKVYSMDFPAKSYCFESYEEACEAAIKYCLENLI